ncbi:MAG TPA: histidine kinase [Gemmatimonadaceae bacterium]|jgi:two-component system LytT family sensor kinase|nr:histidine kinase [Gemmatimonadaceae bacterium]
MRNVRRVAVVSLIWLVVASVFVAQNVAAAIGRGEPVQWLSAAGFELEYWLVFVLATPFFVFMARRYRFEPGERRRSLVVHAIGGVAFALLQPLATVALQYATLVSLRATSAADAQLLTSFGHRYAFLAIVALWKYGVVILLCDAFEYQRLSREHELRAAQLEMQFAQARVGALRMQLQPHFLFNALNSASALTLTDPDGAHRMLTQLGDLLRETLDAAPDAEVPLTAELDFIDRYLAIERMRFDGRLVVSFEVTEDAERARVPSLILQPLVENAVHHAFARHSSARRLVVRAAMEGPWLRLDVEDDGPGLPPGWTFDDRARTGLRNVQARVDLANRASRAMEFAGLAPHGLRVSLFLDGRRAAASAA